MGTNFEFKSDIPESLQNCLETIYLTGNRIRVWYGDYNTGKSWDEENDTIGFVRKISGGNTPILVSYKSSTCGSMLLTKNIIKIIDTISKKILYIHPEFKQSLFTNEGVKVLKDGSIYANCYSEEGAIRLMNFMNGKTVKK